MISLQGLEIVDDFLPLELGITDVILGVQWLQTLGNTYHNWITHTMKFIIGGKPVTLKGDPTLHKTRISLKAMLRTLNHEGAGLIGELGSSTVMTTKEHALHSLAMIEVLQKFEQVFHMPTTLPPRRGHEHTIILRDGVPPIIVRPYRYPQIQNDEIEKLVKEMLAAGIIQPSTIPFSCPILLVKKKDESWNFYIDYRALNKQNLPDKFPIPVIDGLLDELHGASVFSKLDLNQDHQICVRAEDVHKTSF